MSDVRTTGSWLIIWLSALGLGALLWFSVVKQYENGIQDAFSALFNPSPSVKALPENDIPINKVAANPPRTPVFEMNLSDAHTELRAELPKGDVSKSVWEALDARSESGTLKVRIEEYPAADGSDAKWVNNLPEFIRNLPEQSDNADLHLTITDQKTTVTGAIGNAKDKELFTQALGQITPDTLISTESLQVISEERPILSIEKNGAVLELKGQLASEYLANDFAGELKKLTNSTELIDSLRYSPEIANEAAELTNIGAVSELLAANGSRAVIEIKDQQYTINLFGYSGDNPDELRAEVARLLGDVPFNFAVGNVGSQELTPLPETPDEEQGKNVEREILAVNFGFNSYTLTPASEPALNGVLERLWANPNLKLVIEGHTDSTGSPVSNQLLSQQRANAVKNYLVESGISTNRLKALGFGDEKPISSNETSEGRFKNRRIEVREE